MISRIRTLPALAAALAVLLTLSYAPLAGAASTGDASTRAASAGVASAGDVRGRVVDAAGSAIANAHVELLAKGVRLQNATDSSGGFAFLNIAAATYVITASAKGFARLTPRLVAVTAGETTTVELELARAAAGNLATLGRVTVNGRPAISTASAPAVNLDPQDLAGRGVENVSDALSEQIAVTMTRPAGGAPGLPQTASLRGPDPTETLIDIDGHAVNNANTGDFDLELLDSSEFSAVQVVYGVGPSLLDSANTQGGTINFHTIDPTPRDEGLVRVSLGNFNTSGLTLQATGTSAERLGYAFSFHRYNTDGSVHGYPVTDAASGATAILGSAITATSSLMKLRYSFGLGDGFVEATYRNTAAYRDLSAPLSFPVDPQQRSPGALFTTFAGATAQTNSPALGLDLQIPLGSRNASGVAPASVIARHLTSIADQSTVPLSLAAGLNPYLLDDRDLVNDDSAEYDRYLENGTLTVLADTRRETLRLPALAPFAPGITEQSQTQRSFAGRYEWSTTSHLHYTAAAYMSRYDTFGSSLDPRFALVWTPSQDSVIRASFGTGFSAPLLTERAINSTLTAEHTSEFEFGYEHRFGFGELSPTAEIDAYRTNLRNPIFFVPCADPSMGQFCFVANLANVIYQGVEVRVVEPISAAATLHGSYGIDLAYPVNNPFAINPAAPYLVPGQQFQGIPPHKALLSLDGRARSGLGYSLGAAYESSNNELNRHAYWIFNASVAKQINRTTMAIGLQNLTNQFADRFTLNGTGPTYPTPTGLAPTNAYSLSGRIVTFTVTQHL